nr:MAG TPA: hypothetical protein [Caudoviricetes sp.]
MAWFSEIERRSDYRAFIRVRVYNPLTFYFIAI